ncbi:MAG TPA: HDIG domain-containing metalloprotein [Candidatus Obscuribacterales bacterium]
MTNSRLEPPKLKSMLMAEALPDPGAEGSVGKQQSGAFETGKSLIQDVYEFGRDNIAAPLVNAAVIDPWNTYTVGSMKIERLQVSQDRGTAAWVAQTMSSGLGSIVPYVIAGKLAGGALRSTGSALNAQGKAALFFKSEKAAQIIGAAGYDALRAPQAGETRLGNAAGGAAGFGVFSYLNPHTVALNLVWKGVSRATIGAGGSTVQQLVSFAVARQELPEQESLKEAMLAGALLNVGLPPTQHYLGKGFNAVADHVNTRLNRGIPVERFVENTYGTKTKNSGEFQDLLKGNPWTRVQGDANETYALAPQRRIYLAKGNDGPEKLAHEMFEIAAVRSAALEAGYKKAQALLRESRDLPASERQAKMDEAWKVYEQTRAAKESAARAAEKTVARQLSDPQRLENASDPPHLKNPPVVPDAKGIEALAKTEIRPGFTYRDLWRQEFAVFDRLDGRFRPRVDYTSQEPDAKTKDGATKSDITPEQQLEVAKGLIQTLEQAGHDAFAVGGYVRDKLLGVPSKDLDIVTTAMPDTVVKVFQERGMRVYPKGEHYGVISVVVGGKEYEIATTRIDGPYSDGRRPDWVKLGVPIEADLGRRDLTVNAMAENVTTGRRIDPFNGEADLRKGILKAVGKPEDRIVEDPARMMRVPRFISKLDGFIVDPALKRAISLRYPEIERTSIERVRDELNGVLLGQRPVAGLQFMMNSGLMKQVLAEIYRLKGPKGWQDPTWHPEKSTWTHTKLVLQQIQEALRQDPSLLKDVRLRRMLGGLFHDVAKPHTQRIIRDEGGRIVKITNYGHDVKGAEVTEQIMRRMKYPTSAMQHVQGLVRMHMNMHGVTGLSRGKLLAILERPDIMDLIVLQHADAVGTTKPDRLSKSNRDFLLDAIEKAKQTQPHQRPGAKSIVDGEKLKAWGFDPKDHFQSHGLRQGEHFRRIIEAAREAQMEGQFNDLSTAEAWVKETFEQLQHRLRRS